MSKASSENPPQPPRPRRRQFVADTAKMACGVGIFGLALGLYSKRSQALPPLGLRPPGALAEDEFLGACIRCGLCVRDCPYDILFLATPESEVATGTPYFNARTGPCEMCEHIPCVVACPTGALDHSLTDINKSKMGLAVLIDQETCLNFLGLRCDICYRVCPVIDKAITLELQPNTRTGRHALFLPTVHSEHCTGCGKCEKACILDEAAIKILPIAIAKGKIGDHYQLGWEEKRKAGRALIDEKSVVELPNRLPEGVVLENDPKDPHNRDKSLANDSAADTPPEFGSAIPNFVPSAPPGLGDAQESKP